MRSTILGGAVLVEHREWAGGGVEWWHPNPLTGSWVQSGGLGDGRREVDPLGSEVGTEDPFPPTLQVQYADVYGGDLLFLEAGDPFDPRGGCGTIDGLPASCSEVANRAANGSAVLDPDYARGAGATRFTTSITVPARDSDTVHRHLSPVRCFGGNNACLSWPSPTRPRRRTPCVLCRW